MTLGDTIVNHNAPVLNAWLGNRRKDVVGGDAAIQKWVRVGRSWDATLSNSIAFLQRPTGPIAKCSP